MEVGFQPGDAPVSRPEGAILSEVPPNPAANAKYLFYLHGKIIEDEVIRPTHPAYGTYEYEQILTTFEQRGFTVISEARSLNTDVDDYATITAGQIQALIAAGVPLKQITVVGAAKGAAIAMLTSTQLRDRDVNFVLISNGNDWVEDNFAIDLYGRVLSIYDVNDEIGQTCDSLFAKATGLNH